MNIANWIKETTTSIAGTSGDGAVTLTAIANTPRFSTMFGTGARRVPYVIRKISTGAYESGFGSVASNVLTRSNPLTTWDGSSAVQVSATALQFGATPSSGDVEIYLGIGAETIFPTMPATQTVLTRDTNWGDYVLSAANTLGGSVGGITVTADAEYYHIYQNLRAGRLRGVQFQCTTGVASSNVKLALYDVDQATGLPVNKLIDFNTQSTVSTGFKTDTTVATWTPAGDFPMAPGWYAIGFICSHAIGIQGSSGPKGQVPYGMVSSAYGYSHNASKAGSYSTGLPSIVNLSGGSLIAANSFLCAPWIGLRITP